MRKIKFRGQMTTGEWVYGLPHLDLEGSTAYWNECSYRICWNPESGGQANAPIKNGTLCQFTGLKDKNGIEIYEDDIVKSNQLIGTYTVFFKNGSFGLMGNDDAEGISRSRNIGFHSFSHMKEENIEVIGNLRKKSESLI